LYSYSYNTPVSQISLNSIAGSGRYACPSPDTPLCLCLASVLDRRSNVLLPRQSDDLNRHSHATVVRLHQLSHFLTGCVATEGGSTHSTATLLAIGLGLGFSLLFACVVCLLMYQETRHARKQASGRYHLPANNQGQDMIAQQTKPHATLLTTRKVEMTDSGELRTYR